MAASASSADDLSTLHCESTSGAVASVSGTAEVQLPVDADNKYSATGSDLVKASTEPASKIPSPASEIDGAEYGSRFVEAHCRADSSTCSGASTTSQALVAESLSTEAPSESLDSAAVPDPSADISDHESVSSLLEDLPISVPVPPLSPATEGEPPERTQTEGSSPAAAANLQNDQTTGDAAAQSTPSHVPLVSQSNGTPYTFSGVPTIVGNFKSAVTALSFGRLDSELLAFGSDDGCLRVANVSSSAPSILHEMHDHQGRIADLAWSYENQQLISVSEDGLVCVSSHDNELWTVQRSMRTMTAALCCRFHPINQNLVLVGTAGSTIEVFNTSTGLTNELCQAVLTSYGSEGVRAVVMDVSHDAIFVGDSLGYIHILRLLLVKGQLQPLVLLGRVPPPGSQLEPLASLSYTSWSEVVKGPALLAAGTDDIVAIYKVIPRQVSRVWIEKGISLPLTARMGSKMRLELSSKHLMPLSARPIRASWCPTLPSCEYIALGGENTAVNVWDISDSEAAPVAVTTLQGHRSPVVAVAWSFEESRLASSDVDGTVIVWKREQAEMTHK